MITVNMSNDIFIPDVPFDLERVIRRDLTFPNPDYTQAQRMGRSTYDIPEYIRLYKRLGNDYILPRGYSGKLAQLLKGQQINFIDNRLTLPKVEFKSNIQLRNYQVPAVEALVKNIQGGVVAACGSGKTQILLEAMARIGQPTLWVCHTKELLEQTKDRACSVLDLQPEEIGIIASGKFSIGKRLTIALIQSLKKQADKIKMNFGALLIDEAHHLPADTFFNTLNKFPAKYRLWASATPQRSDGLTQMVFMAGGPVQYEVDRAQLPTITPRLQVVETAFTSSYSSDEYAKLLNSVVLNDYRNRLIVNLLAKEAPGNYSLVLSERIEHLEILQEQLSEAAPELSTAILTGAIKKKERAAIMEQVRNKEIDVLLATKLAREGLDIPHLNRLFMVCPKKSPSAVEQEAGRVARPAEGKADAVIFDFWDVRHPILKNQFWGRLRVYKQIGIKWNSTQKAVI